MKDDVYKRLSEVLDTLPNGFPATENGAEIKLLKKIFRPEQAELFCDMKLSFETATQIAERTGRPVEGLEAFLTGMSRQGQLFMIEMGETKFFRMMPWVFGVYEFQLGHMDKELAELNEAYAPVYGKSFFAHTPQLMKSLAVETTIPVHQEALPYEKVSSIIETGQSFLVNECICKKEKGLLGAPCDRPVEVCLAIAPIPGLFDKSPRGKCITREEAYALLDKAEEDALVHLTSNVQAGQYYICNCCKCCCGVLGAINKLGIPASLVINSRYYAQIDADACIGCGLCADERCQVGAIESTGDVFRVAPERCIGCGLCVRTCPSEAIRMVSKEPEKIVPPPITESDWFEERGRERGVDFSRYK